MFVVFFWRDPSVKVGRLVRGGREVGFLVVLLKSDCYKWLRLTYYYL